MKRVTLCLLCGVLRWSCGHAADVEPPGLRCPQPIHDFGRVRGGERVSHEFLLTNAGPVPVEISDVKSSCGCLALGDWPRRLEPGVSGTIPFEFDTANYSGPIHERVTVRLTDAAQPELTLRVEAIIWWPVEVTPRAAKFDFGANSGTNARAVVRIVNQEEAPLDVGPPESTHRALAATLRTNVAGREFELTVNARPPLPGGNIFGQVKLTTSSGEMPLLEIPVFGLLQPDVVLAPAQLALPAERLGEPWRQSVLVRSFWTNALEVSAPTVSDPAVVVQLKTVEPGLSHQVELTYPAGFRPSPGQRLGLKLETNHPRHRVLRIPISVGSACP